MKKQSALLMKNRDGHTVQENSEHILYIITIVEDKCLFHFIKNYVGIFDIAALISAKSSSYPGCLISLGRFRIIMAALRSFMAFL
jgi:hypothetical protein